MKKYKVIFVDWNGTLSKSKFWDQLEKPQPELFKQIEQSLFVNYKHLIKPWMRGNYTSEEILNLISEDSGIEYEFLLQELIKGCQQMSIPPKVISLIKQLRGLGKKVVIASDNMDTFVRWTIPALKLSYLFDDILDSYTLKSGKRDVDDQCRSLFFRRYLTTNQINPGESAIIDDAEDKDSLIQKFGIDYYQLTAQKGLEKILKEIILSS